MERQTWWNKLKWDYIFQFNLYLFFIPPAQYLFEQGWHAKGLIGVTEPRRISALTLAERVAQERGELTGESVGVSVRFIEKVSPITRIKVSLTLNIPLHVHCMHMISHKSLLKHFTECNNWSVTFANDFFYLKREIL